MGAQLYALIYVILEHPQILVSVGGLEPISLGMPRDNLSFAGLGSYTWIFDHVRVGTPNSSVDEVSTV